MTVDLYQPLGARHEAIDLHARRFEQPRDQCAPRGVLDDDHVARSGHVRHEKCWTSSSCGPRARNDTFRVARVMRPADG